MAAPDTIQIQQSRLNLEATRELRRRLEQHAKSIGITDGANKAALREWLQGVDNAAAWTQANDTLLLEMVGYLSIGSLATLIRESLEAMIQDPTGPPCGWQQVKEAIIASFLDEDEREYLRSKVDDIVQNPYEDSREYGRRYKEATRRAYEATELQLPLVMERLTRQFTQGLRDKAVRTQVFMQRPGTIDAAVEIANGAARAVGLAELSQRQEETMEVGAMPLPEKPEDGAGELKDFRQLL